MSRTNRYLARNWANLVLLMVVSVMLLNIVTAVALYYFTGQRVVVALFLGFGAVFALSAMYVELVNIRQILQYEQARRDRAECSELNGEVGPQ